MYLDQPYLEGMLGAAKVAALCPGGATQIARTIDAAEAETETALLNGGYPNAVPASVYASLPEAGVDPVAGQCPKAISLLAYGAWLELVHGGQGIELPPQFAAYVKKLDLVRTGKMELPGLAKKGVDKDTTRAPGGVSFTDSSASTDGTGEGRPPVFDRTSMREGGF